MLQGGFDVSGGCRAVSASLDFSWTLQGGAAGRRRRVRRRKAGRRKARQTLYLPSRFALIPCEREIPREREKALRKKEARVRENKTV